MSTAVLDLFAGTGWGVACNWLGAKEYGVELMPEAVATREVVGFETIYRDVWDGLFDESLVPAHGTLIASPPCQTFSVAGRGEGRRALDDILEAIKLEAWRHPEQLKTLGTDLGDERTALVLTPLAYIWRHRPRYVALEQVPTVLPVWEEIASTMRELMGYNVWTGNLQAEQYGVPQTRKRAILMASLDGPVGPPRPSHSRYYPRDPQRLDPGVKKWVSMAEALGWGAEARPAPTVTGHGFPTRQASGQQSIYFDAIERGGFIARNGASVEESRLSTYDGVSLSRSYDSAAVNFSPAEAATLQSYPEWCFERPSTTVVGSFRPDVIAAPGYRTKGGPSRQDAPGSVRLSLDGVATLQSFPTPFPFQGSKTKQFLQIGNAVPPLLGRAILEELWGCR